MLSGQRAFKGDDISDTLAAVLRQDVDWTALPASTPAPMRRLIAAVPRSGRQAAAARHRRSADRAGGSRRVRRGRREVRRLRRGAIAVAPPQPFWRRAMPVVLSAIVAGVAGRNRRVVPQSLTPATPLAVTRLPFTLPEGQVFTGTWSAVIRWLCRRTARRWCIAANGRLYLRSMSELDVQAIQGTEGYRDVDDPVFSPDGRSIVFYAVDDQTLKKIAVTGGAAVTIRPGRRPVSASAGDRTASSSAKRSKGIMRVSPNGGTPDVLVQRQGWMKRRTARRCCRAGSTCCSRSRPAPRPIDGTKRESSCSRWRRENEKRSSKAGADARYVPTGHLVYALGGQRVRGRVRRAAAGGEGWPVPMVEGVRRAAGGCDWRSPLQLLQHRLPHLHPWPGLGIVDSMELALTDRKGEVERLKLPPGPYVAPRVSPDGTRIAFGTDDGKEAIVWIYDLSGTTHDAPTHVRREQPLSDLVLGRQARRVSVRSRRRPRHLLAARRRHGHGRTPHEAGAGRITCAGVVVSEGRPAAVQHHEGVRRVVVDVLAAGQEGDALR